MTSGCRSRWPNSITHNAPGAWIPAWPGWIWCVCCDFWYRQTGQLCSQQSAHWWWHLTIVALECYQSWAWVKVTVHLWTFYTVWLITSNVTGHHRGPKCKLQAYAQHSFANSVNFLVTWGLSVTISIPCAYFVYMVWQCTGQHCSSIYACTFVCRYLAPPGECYYNISVMLQLFFVVECGNALFLCAMHVFEVQTSSSSPRLPLCQISFPPRSPLLS